MARIAAGIALVLVAALLAAQPPSPASAEVDASPARLAGPDRVATAADVATHTFAIPSETTTALVARADAFPDALTAAGLAGVLDVPILLTRHASVPDDTAAALDALGVERVLLLGGEAAIGQAVADELSETRDVRRLAGEDRFGTAAAIAHEAVAATDAAGEPPPDTVVVVRGDQFADALTAGAPAYAQGWPILLTHRDRVPDDTAQVLADLEPANALVLGGQAAVSDAVVADLEARGLSVERIAGHTRTGTATALATHLTDRGWSDDTAVLARGDDFADALASAPLAGRAQAPILLAQTPTLLGPDAAGWLVGRCPDVDRIVAIGGAAALRDDTLDEAHHARLDCVPLPGPMEVRYRVEAHDGADGGSLVSAAEAALGDPRGWSLDGAIRFAPTDGAADLTLRLAAPESVAAADPRCAAGRCCRVGDVLWIDADRWGSPPAGWGDAVAEYRRYLVNHLVGRWLGLPEAGCAGGTAPVMADQTTGATACAPGPWPTEVERARVRARHVPTLTIAFGGDVHGEGRVRNHLLAGGNPLEVIAPVLSAADLAVLNLETAVGVRGSPQPGKTFTFQAPPQLLPALREGGVDVVTLANNHALDYGHEALFETIQRSRDADLVPVGAGGDAAAAYAPAILEVGRRTVAVVGLSRVLPPGWAAGPGRPGIASAYDVAAAEQAVRAAAAQADLVVVAIHWGVELAECPVSHQLDLANRLTAAGAHVIAGHHPHILQGIQRRGDALVGYSLGNFVWYHSRSPSRYTGVWTVELDGRGAIGDTFTPADIDSLGRPVPVSGTLEAQIHADVARRSPGGGRCSF